MAEHPTSSLRTAPRSAAVEINRVLRNTYLLLGMTLAFSAVVAGVSLTLNLPHPGIIPWLIGFFALLFIVHKTANSSWGLLSVFAFTGFLGYGLGPILNMYLGLPNGGTLVSSALGTTAFAFVGLSAYALITRKDFGFLSGFLMVGFFVLMGAVLLSLFVDLSAFQVAISAGFVLFASAAILWQTSAIIHGGETNYILATVTLYVSIYNLLLSLLHIFGALGDD
ncbi:MAG: Bax inhibitor-1/YccA family protein [Pseudomonadales bacterium]|nr:Bax inhibitor-1/YccA family protein [Pseudomonadales bacterium]